MPFIVAIVLLVAISLLLHFLSPWWLTPIASNWGAIDDTIHITFWVTGFVFVTVNLFMAYAVYRFRYNKNRRAHYEPENKKLELWLTGFTAFGIMAMLAPGLFVWADFVKVPENAHEVEVLGQQWQWSFRYPGEDGVLGSADATYINADNPFGLNPDDPHGQDDVLVFSQEMHLPIGRPVKLLLRSKDVLHDYSVAQFRVKMDMVPGSVSFLWLTPTVSGGYEILCEELCGIGHHIMRGRVVVESQDEFDTWLEGQQLFADTRNGAPANLQAGQAHYAICASCHGANGEGNESLNAPKLAGQQGWYLKRQLGYYRNGIRGVHEDDVYGKQMAPMAATLTNQEAIDNVVAYIESLPDQPAPRTVQGDPARGRMLYEPTCGICHGADAKGIWAVNAPALAGMSDWYLVRQLENYKSGVRGVHAGDEFGFQMRSMVSGLKNSQAINDVVAYINTLQVQDRTQAHTAGDHQ
ncbi:c-type cytochrome [Gilvimarinus sp. F26214L]|uniref:c-type cytochrome n=1 Tax=Gilvimarinus sp. DZF01 TaxID=3461371 RepID=UPI0040455725